jgi:hypothetical protein
LGRRKGFEVTTSTGNLFSSRLICHLFRESVFIQYRKTGQVVDVLSEFPNQDSVKAFYLSCVAREAILR